MAGLTQAAPKATATRPIPTATPAPSATPTTAPAPTKAPATATVAPTAAPTKPAATGVVTATLTYKSVLRDAFETDQGWVKGVDRENKEFGFRLIKGAYIITAGVVKDLIYSIRNGDYTDVRLEADVARDNLAIGDMGVICRFVNGSNYYGFTIGTDGSYQIIKKKTGLVTRLAGGTIAGSLTQPVHIVADCIGNTLTLTANGQQLAQVKANDFPNGAVGMAAGSRNDTGFAARFTLFEIKVPEK
jgi:hypothetical protein